MSWLPTNSYKFHIPLTEGNLKLIVVRNFYPKNLENPPTQSCIAQRLEFHFAIDQKEEAQQLVLVAIFPAKIVGSQLKNNRISLQDPAEIEPERSPKNAPISHGSLNVPIFHITQPLGIKSIMATIRWCPIFPSHGTFTNPCFSPGNFLRFSSPETIDCSDLPIGATIHPDMRQIRQRGIGPTWSPIKGQKWGSEKILMTWSGPLAEPIGLGPLPNKQLASNYYQWSLLVSLHPLLSQEFW